MNNKYISFNENLMQGLNPTVSVFKQEAVTTAVTDQKTYDGNGFLTVQVSLARGAYPVKGADVVVSGSAGEPEFSVDLTTDQSGRTQRVTLPAPRSSYSQTPDNGFRPYGIYDVKVSLPGYYTENALNVQIFDQVESIQPISLRPISQNDVPREEIFVDEGLPNYPLG